MLELRFETMFLYDYKAYTLDRVIGTVHCHLLPFYQLPPMLKHFADHDFASIPSPIADVGWLEAGC